MRFEGGTHEVLGRYTLGVREVHMRYDGGTQEVLGRYT